MRDSREQLTRASQIVDDPDHPAWEKIAGALIDDDIPLAIIGQGDYANSIYPPPRPARATNSYRLVQALIQWFKTKGKRNEEHNRNS